jgi:hypothetical protein
MPRKFTAPVITINFRLPPKLHRQLEQIAKRGGTSINAEVVQRLESSIKWPKAEDLAMALLLQAVASVEPSLAPVADKLTNSLLEDLGGMLGADHPVRKLGALFRTLLEQAGEHEMAESIRPKGKKSEAKEEDEQ